MRTFVGILVLILLPVLLAQPAAAGDDWCHCDVDPDVRVTGDQLLANLPAPQATVRARHMPYGGVGFGRRDGTGPLAGIPKGRRELVSEDYVVLYDQLRRVPLVTAHRLRKADLVSAERSDCFRADPRLEAAESAQCSDYFEHRFDQGHMVPRADMNRSPQSMVNTFVLSNMVPQYAPFNQKLWRKFEAIVRDWAHNNNTIHVFSGAVFDGDGDFSPDDESEAERMTARDGARRVAVPTHFYKVALRQDVDGDGGPDVIAVLLPHRDRDPGSCTSMLRQLSHGLVTLRLIERLGGVYFFPEMPAAQAMRLKTREAERLWDHGQGC